MAATDRSASNTGMTLSRQDLNAVLKQMSMDGCEVLAMSERTGLSVGAIHQRLSRMHRKGSPGRRKPLQLNRPCSFQGCPRNLYRKGLCWGHLKQSAAGQELVPLPPKRESVKGRTCQVAGCYRPMRSSRLCNMHYQRKYVKKDPYWNRPIALWRAGRKHFPVTLSLPVQVIEALLKEASGRGVSRSRQVCDIVEWYFKAKLTEEQDRPITWQELSSGTSPLTQYP